MTEVLPMKDISMKHEVFMSHLALFRSVHKSHEFFRAPYLYWDCMAVHSRRHSRPCTRGPRSTHYGSWLAAAPGEGRICSPDIVWDNMVTFVTFCLLSIVLCCNSPILALISAKWILCSIEPNCKLKFESHSTQIDKIWTWTKIKDWQRLTKLDQAKTLIYVSLLFHIPLVSGVDGPRVSCLCFARVVW